MNIVNISLNKIVPDENQPRKFFDESRMATLKSSIKSHGIKNPLTLEVMKGGTYLIQDGERRFRAAKSLGLKQVPAIIVPEVSEVQRLIEQFHLQEQHEGWSSIEKAVAVTKLADTMNTSVADIGRLLSINEGSLKAYLAFGKLIDKKGYEKTKIGTKWAGYINGTRDYIKRIYHKHEMTFDRNQAKAFENAVYKRIRDGEELNSQFFTKIKDSVTQVPKLLEEFINDDSLTVDQLFKKSHAYGAQYLRKIETNASYLGGALDAFMKDKSIQVTPQAIARLKLLEPKIKEFLGRFSV